MKIFLSFVLVLLSFTASANQPPQYCTAMVGNTWSGGCTASPPFDTNSAWAIDASNAYLAAQNSSHPGYPRYWVGSLSVGAFAITTMWSSRTAEWMNGVYHIADNWSGSSNAVCPAVAGVRAAPSGTVEATACPGTANACIAKVGTVITRNVTAGYMNKGFTQASYPSYLPNGQPAPGGYTGTPPSSMCIDSCVAYRGAVQASWSSMEPTATGFYRISDDWEFTYTLPGTPCTATSDENASLDPAHSVPACVGFVGQVSGKTTCVPSVPDMSSRGISNANSNVGNPTAGSTGGAANIPATGGNGANAGGPVGVNDGGLMTPSGLVPKAPSGTASAVPPSTPASGTEASCGAPGEPTCAINETGTPNAPDASIVRSADKYKSDMDTFRATVAGSGDKAFFSGWGTLFSAPAVVACTPFVLPAFMGGPSLGSIDPCPVVDGVRTVMGYIWALTAMIMSLGMIRKVI